MGSKVPPSTPTRRIEVSGLWFSKLDLLWRTARLYISSVFLHGQVGVGQNRAQSMHDIGDGSMLSTYNPKTYCQCEFLAGITTEHNTWLWFSLDRVNFFECLNNQIMCLILDECFFVQCGADGCTPLVVEGVVDHNVGKDHSIGYAHLFTADQAQFGDANAYIFYFASVARY